EPEPVADDQAAAARRLHVAPVPVALALGDRQERLALRPVPVPAVAAEADAHLVGLGPARRDILVAAPDGEQAQEQTLVSHAVEIVEFTDRLEVVALRVEAVGAAPQRRLVDALPLRAG